MENLTGQCFIILAEKNLPCVQELLFCETCDSVFCTLCTGGSHKPGGGGGGGAAGGTAPTSTADHTVIPFSIAIKRMSEILIYKANECTAKVKLLEV